ncbi:MAG: hypothetical protein ABIP74_02485 [Candidatus Saccharimonas sp.]
MKYTQIAFGVGAALTAGLIYAAPVFAEDAPSCSVLPNSICSTSTQTNTSDVSQSSVFQIIIWVLRIMTGAVGIAAVGALIYAGVLYGSSSGESAQVSKAKTIIKDTAIGLVAYGFMFIILNWLIPGGIFGS